MMPSPQPVPNPMCLPVYSEPQMHKVRTIILRCLHNQPHAAHEIQSAIKHETGTFYSESGVTARIRELRSERFGSHQIECKYLSMNEGKRRFEYWIEKPQSIFDVTGRSGPEGKR